MRIAEDNGKLIGIVASTFKRLKIGDSTFLCGELGDLSTHPDYRRRGIFTALTREVCRESDAGGVSVLYARPNESSFPGLVRLGFEQVFSVCILRKVLNVRNVLDQRLPGWLPSWAGRLAGRLLPPLLFRETKVAIPPGITLSRVSDFDEGIDRLWERAADRHRVIVVRDKAYLNWRYTRNPGEYGIHVARKGSSTVGYVVTSQETQCVGGLRRGYVVDLLTDGGEPLLARALTAKALDDFRRQGLDVAITWVVRTSEFFRVLRTCGFVPSRKELRFVVRTHGMTADQEAQLRESRNWFFRLGDTDGI